MFLPFLNTLIILLSFVIEQLENLNKKLKQFILIEDGRRRLFTSGGGGGMASK